MNNTHKKTFPFCRAFVPFFIALVLVIGLSGPAFAQDTRTVFSIGDLNASFTYPLRAYAVSGNNLVLADTWRPLERDGGPVGLAVDPYNQRLFVSYEFSPILDIFDATDATPLGQITLFAPPEAPAVDDVCGMDVHESRGQLFVVDREEMWVYVFDTATHASADTWQLPSGNGAWDIEIVEDLDGQDVLFVTDASNIVRWYDIDTYLEVGSATQTTAVAVGLSVYIKDSGYPIIFTAAEGGAHSVPGSQYLSKYDVEMAAQNSVLLGSGTGRGVAVNQNDGHVYVSVEGGGLFLPPTLRVYDVETLAELSRVNLGNAWSPTDVEATWLAFGSTVQKELTSHPSGVINMSDEVIFEITIINQNSRPIHILPLKDVYDTTHFTYLYAEDPYTSDDNVDDGEIDWTDLIAQRGSDLPYGESITVTVHFQAQPEGCEDFVNGTNLAQSIGAEDDFGHILDDTAGSVDYRLNCVCVVDEDCDDGLFCNGEELCIDGQCVPGENPCPTDDEIFCNGEETYVCLEETDECGHTGNPCGDDGEWCNGEEICIEDSQSCENTGNPCEEDEVCNERLDICESQDADDDTSDEIPTDPGEGDPGWPEGEVTGGCCGCE